MAKRNNDNDLIRRGDVRDALMRMSKPLVGGGIASFVVDYPQAVDSVQAVDAKPVVRAEWVKNDDGWYNCSNCGNEMFFTGVYDDNQQYCYFCGADMRLTQKLKEAAVDADLNALMSAT